MKNLIYLMVFYIGVFGLLTCDDEADTIVGARDHNIKTAEVTEPQILADGVSTTTIKAVVTDQDGKLANGMKVVFQTTHGEITPFVYTNYYGEVDAILISEASFKDINAEVTATVVDTTFDNVVTKNKPHYSIEIKTPDFPQLAERNKLKKGTKENSYEATLKIKFIGISIKPTVEDTTMPADGISKTKISVKIFETTSQNPINGVEVTVAPKYGSVENLSKTNQQGITETWLTAAKVPLTDSITVSIGNRLAKTVRVNYVEPKFTLTAEKLIIAADGQSTTKIIATLLSNKNNPIINAEVHFSTSNGIIPQSAFTDNMGRAQVNLVAATKADSSVIITARFISLEKTIKVSFVSSLDYVNPKFTLTTDKMKIVADGQSTIKVTATLLTSGNNPIIGANVTFTSSNGVIPASATTDNLGRARVNLVAANEPDPNVVITARFLTITRTKEVAFVTSALDEPNSIVIETNPNFIWVKETGRLEQTKITATILNIHGDRVGNDIQVRFSIVAGPDGGEYVTPSDGSPSQSLIIPTVDGQASANIRAGIKAGTVRIRTDLIDFPEVAAKTTSIVIRSGPAYIWIDPANKNNVIHHATLVCEATKHNVAFANPVQDIKMTAIFGDKYNNPVEQGTAVYFTTTGGIVTSDALTNEKGQTSVILQNTNPFPYYDTADPDQLTSCCIPNPNDESLMLDLAIPDFEGSEVPNSVGDFGPNDGVAVVLAYTWGEDQNGNTVKVWTTKYQVFSSGILKFTASTDRTTLDLGESATISIVVYDIHGNPVSAGSRLNVSTNKGNLSETSLMPSAEAYGYGQTHFETTLTNNLDPSEDDPGTAVVTISINGPNGHKKTTVEVEMTLNP